MDKLLSDRFYENKTTKNRRTFEKNAQSDNLEAMENGKQKNMGTYQTRNKSVAGKTDVGVQEPIYGSKQNARHKESNFQRKTDQARLSQRFRLLPKGTYLILS